MWPEPASPGEICRHDSVLGTVSTNGFLAGLNWGSRKESSPNYPTAATLKRFLDSTIVRAHQHAAGAQKKLAGWSDRLERLT